VTNKRSNHIEKKTRVVKRKDSFQSSTKGSQWQRKKLDDAPTVMTVSYKLYRRRMMFTAKIDGR